MGEAKDSAIPPKATAGRSLPDSARAAPSGVPTSPAQRVGNVNLAELIRRQLRAEAAESPEERRSQERMAARQRTAGDVASAISAFGDSRKAAALRDVYLDLRALDGNIDDLFAASGRIARAGVAVEVPARSHLFASDEYGHRLDPLREDLRSSVSASIEMRLQRYGLTIATFERQIEHFKQAFSAATMDLGVSLLDQAEGLCQWYLADVHELQSAAGNMVSLLGTERKSIAADVLSADDLEDKAGMPVGGEMKDELRTRSKRLRADAHARVMSALAGYPFVRWPEFPLEALVQSRKPEDVAALVRAYLEKHVSDIRDARSQINPQRIYQLNLLLASAKERFGIHAGSLAALLIQEQKERVGTSILQKIETALAFALMVTSLVFPAAAPVTVPLSAGIGAHAAGQSILQYREDRTAYQAGLASENPSPLWALAAVIGAGLEITAALRLLRIKPVAEAIARFNKSRRVAGLSRDLERAGVNSTTRDAITREAEEIARGTQSGATSATQPSGAPSPAAPSEVPSPAAPSSTASPPAPRPARQVPVQQAHQQQLTGPRKPPTDTPPGKPAAPAPEPEVDPASLGAEPDPDLAAHLGADPADLDAIAKDPGLNPAPIRPRPRDPARTAVKHLVEKVKKGKATVKTGGHYDRRLTPGKRRALDHEISEEARAEEERIAEQIRARDARQRKLEEQQRAQRERQAKKKEEVPPAADGFEDIDTAEMDLDDL